MLSGMIVWGGVGWLLDRWLETRVFTLVGVLLGLGVAIYLVVIKYGSVEPLAGAGRPASTTRSGQRSRPRQNGQTQKGRR
jgi:F0F1-type ATP synthase assembly protein I